MSDKRATRRKAKPGELCMFYGRLPGYAPDVIYAWGDGTSRRDSHLLNCVIGSERPGLFPNDPFEKSLLDELTDRGYDITTLKFSIMKKVAHHD